MREILKRFNYASLEVPTVTPKVKINALTNGLRDGDLFSSLDKKPVTSFDYLLNSAQKCITLEEIRKTKKFESKPAQSEKRREFESKIGKSKSRAESSRTSAVGP